jgi:hypothetical protein
MLTGYRFITYCSDLQVFPDIFLIDFFVLHRERKQDTKQVTKEATKREKG